MSRMFLLIFLCLCVVTGYASNRPLPPEKAFEFSPLVDNNKVFLEWNIAPGYFLYKKKMTIKVASSSQVKINKVLLPAGKTKKDEVHGVIQVYTGKLKVPVTLMEPSKGILQLVVNFQGCSEKGFCYPAMDKEVRIDLAQAQSAPPVQVTGALAASASQDMTYTHTLYDHSSYFVIIMSFLGIGLLLAFTPCVLPMIPILSGIIVGQGNQLTTGKAFSLSFAYVLGMALTYAIAGIFVAMVGSSIQVVFQNPWVIGSFSILFVLLALSLFGYYELQLPARWQRRLTSMSNNQKSGTYIGVFLMGVLSSLIVSPCVSAPLVGVLAYIAQTGNMVLGGFALLALGFGMGIPLLIIGTSAGKLLPKAGAWMETVKKIFGLVMLGVAIFMVSRIIPGPLTMILWAALCIGSAYMLVEGASGTSNWNRAAKSSALFFAVYGIVLIASSVTGNSDPLHPWEKSMMVATNKDKKANPAFTTVANMREFDTKLAEAKRDHKAVVLDFYADWCESCVWMDRNIFNQPQIKTAYSDIVWIRADVTKNSSFDQQLLKRFNVIAPPTIVFFDRSGQELSNQQIVGEVSAQEFVDHAQSLG